MLRRAELRKVPAPTVRGHLFFRLASTTPVKTVSCSLDSSLLGRPAAVVRQRRDVLNAGDFQAGVLQIENGLFAAGAGAFDLDLDLDHAVLARLRGRAFGGATGGEGRALAVALEADCSRAGPGDGLDVGVGDRDHGVVKGGLDERNAAGDALADAFFLAGP
jgi:hypothetical protein